MYCSKCGKKLDEGVKFCSGCGNKIVDEIVNIPSMSKQKDVVTTNKTNITSTEKKKIPALSWVSLGLLLAKLLVTIISYVLSYNAVLTYTEDYYSNDYNYFSELGFLSLIPFLTASLVTSIVSRVKHKDTMSLVVMIVDIVLIALAIIGVIIVLWFVSSTIAACGESMSNAPF